MRSLYLAWARGHDAWVGLCARCAAPSRSAQCPSCRRAPALGWELEGVPGWSAAPYADRISDLIQQLKYRDETRWASTLGGVLHDHLAPFIAPHGILVPVPLHPRRLAERGYNQAALIARALGHRSSTPIRTDVLRRVRDTAAQARLGGGARRDNVREAFVAVNLPAAPVVLVDDVTTTGATVRECVLCLRRAGAIVHGVMTVALAGQDGPTAHRSPQASGFRDRPEPTARPGLIAPAGAGHSRGAIRSEPGAAPDPRRSRACPPPAPSAAHLGGARAGLRDRDPPATGSGAAPAPRRPGAAPHHAPTGPARAAGADP